MKKGLFLGTVAALSLLLSTQVLAETQQQTWQIKFKQFIYVWINTDEVIFDFTKSANEIDSSKDGVLAGGQINGKTYYVAAKDTLYQCSGAGEDFGTYDPGSSNFTGVPNAPTSVSDANCHFAPSEVVVDDPDDSNDDSYDATYDNGNGVTDAKADTDLLVAALGIDHFKVTQISATAVPAGLTLQFFPGAAKDGNLVTKSGGSDPKTAPAELSSSSSSVSLNNWTGSNFGYYVDGMYFYYLFPVSHGLVLDPSDLDLGAFDFDNGNTTYSKDITITYTVAAF